MVKRLEALHNLAVCLERKGKCYGTRPACGKCLRSHLPCPGHFHRMLSRISLSLSPLPSAGSRKRARRATSMENDEEPEESPRPSKAIRSASATAAPLARQSIPRISPSAGEGIKDKFVSFLDHHPLARYLYLSWYDTFLHDVPQLLGTCPVLDEAAASLASTDVTLPRTAAVSPQSSSHYVQALRLLQTALADEERSKSPGVLCATALLQSYELCATPNHTFWIQHAGGAARLIQSRGPEAHRDGISRAILEALRGNIVINCIASRKHCFLAEPAWVEVISDDKLSFYTGPEDSRRERSRLRRHQIYLLMAYLPGILEDSARLVDYTASEASQFFPLGQEREYCLALLQRIITLRRSLTSWRLCYFGTLGYVDNASLRSREDAGTSTSTAVVRRGPIYSDYVSSSLDCTANCTVIVVDCLLGNLMPLLDILPAQEGGESPLEEQLPTLDDIIQESSACADIARRSYTFTKAHSPASAKWIAHGFTQAWHVAYEQCSVESQPMWDHLMELWGGFAH